MKKIVLSLLVLSIALTGLSVPFVNAKKPVEVIYWEKWTGMESGPIMRVVDEFNKSQDEIVVKYLDVSDIDQKIKTSIAAGRGPDLSGGRRTVMMDLAENNLLLALDDLYKEAGLSQDDFFPAVWDEGTYKGKQYGQAITSLGWLMYYNKKIFREVGLDPENPPKTVKELEEAYKKIMKEDENGNLLRIGFHFREPGDERQLFFPCNDN